MVHSHKSRLLSTSPEEACALFMCALNFLCLSQTQANNPEELHTFIFWSSWHETRPRSKTRDDCIAAAWQSFNCKTKINLNFSWLKYEKRFPLWTFVRPIAICRKDKKWEVWKKSQSCSYTRWDEWTSAGNPPRLSPRTLSFRSKQVHVL